MSFSFRVGKRWRNEWCTQNKIVCMLPSRPRSDMNLLENKRVSVNLCLHRLHHSWASCPSNSKLTGKQRVWPGGMASTSSLIPVFAAHFDSRYDCHCRTARSSDHERQNERPAVRTKSPRVSKTEEKRPKVVVVHSTAVTEV